MLTNDTDLHNGAAIGQTFKGMPSIFNLISMAMLISQNGLDSPQLQQTLLFVNFFWSALLNTTGYI